MSFSDSTAAQLAAFDDADHADDGSTGDDDVSPFATLGLSAPGYARLVAIRRAPLLAEIAAEEVEHASLRADLDGYLTACDRETVWELFEACSDRLDHARGLLPSNTPMWG